MNDSRYPMDNQEDSATPLSVRKLLTGQVSRRTLVTRGAILGVSIPVIGGLLAACGGSSKSTPTTSSSGQTTPPPTQASGSPAAASTTASTAASGTPSTGAATGTSAATAASTAAAAPEGQPGGTVNLGLLRDPIAFDPHIAYGASSASLQGNVYDTLLSYDLKGAIAPSLATSFEVQQDGKVYVFKLQSGVTFHDGTPLSADDVLYTFDRIRNPKTAANLTTQFGFIDSYTAPDATTVQVT
ncbi:MAG TPA: ABC transporter substrate-binding protein, partial [Nitrolancea sp.]|nr:ABC transporter substrate-binding protein [Nitrolancea sp.]